MPAIDPSFGSIAFSPTFFIRYEGGGRVEEIQLKASDLSSKAKLWEAEDDEKNQNRRKGR
jgi:hypothetical protein